MVGIGINTLATMVTNYVLSTITEAFGRTWIQSRSIARAFATIKDFLDDFKIWFSSEFHLHRFKSTVVSTYMRLYLERLAQITGFVT